MKPAWLEPEQETAFLAFLLECGALRFGEFTLKSGRRSPYFFNTARFETGGQLTRLGEAYARVILRLAPQATIVYGPAYKGIPLALSAAQAVEKFSGRETGWLFDRKEAKTHGDKGPWVGREPGPEDRLVLVDDVMTDGETKRQAVAALRRAFPAPIDGLVIAFDRMEKDPQGHNAVQAFTRETGIPVAALFSLARLEHTLEHNSPLLQSALETQGADRTQVLTAIRAYRQQYGIEDGAGS
ncbi:MAG: orotate phosphoribosyltransferase [Deltaproteobacteria bacterium]|nr:orotate phosphoribosyltransferase [Deltaproteobacteria bacterium]